MKENLNDLISNVSLIENDNLKTNEIHRILEFIDSYEMNDYQLYYLKGHLWYSIPTESYERDIKVVENLKKSIRLNKNYIHSKTELAYFYFDKKKYSKVIKLLEGLDLSIFEENNQMWKSLKLQELLLVSKLWVSKIVDKKLNNDFFELISSYLYLPEEELAVPSELINSIFKNKEKEGICNVAKNVYQLINSKNQKDYFDDDDRSNLKSIIQNGNILN